MIEENKYKSLNGCNLIWLWCHLTLQLHFPVFANTGVQCFHHTNGVMLTHAFIHIVSCVCNAFFTVFISLNLRNYVLVRIQLKYTLLFLDFWPFPSPLVITIHQPIWQLSSMHFRAFLFIASSALLPFGSTYFECDLLSYQTVSTLRASFMPCRSLYYLQYLAQSTAQGKQ